MKFPRILALAGCVCLAPWVARPALAVLPDIYPPPERAGADLADALHAAAARHVRVILDFGGNWCGDCHVLDGYFHDADNAPVLAANFELVHVNVGRMDQNLQLATRYGIPLKKGVPALAVVDSRGRLLYRQAGGEFEDMRHLESSAVSAFLARWKPPAHRALRPAAGP